MNEFDKISEDLFNKIRGRFPNVTIGAADGKVTNQPNLARFFDFDYNGLGKVSVAIDEDDGLTIIYSKDFMQNEDELTKEAWYDFLKELRVFSKKRMLDYSVRDITKSNLNKRDYNFLAKTPEDGQMTESKLYGTSRISYQKIGEARIVIKHTEGVNQESATGRTQKIGKIYIESADGERFRYPFKHLSGARAMARHVAEGGNTYDDFGKHIVGLSEEMAKLRKFKNYMGRSAVMAESLAGYVDVVKERIATVKKTIGSLQKPAYYAEAFAAFETPMMEDVPTDVAENWIDQLTIKQFNEELSDVFPYIYKLVSEANKAKELGPEDLEEGPLKTGSLDQVQGPADTVKVRPGMTIFAIAKMFNDQNNMGGDVQEFAKEIMDINKITDPSSLQVGQVLQMPYSMGTGPSGASRGLPPGGFATYEDEIESAFEDLMGQFGEKETDADEGNAYAHAVKKAKMDGKKKGDKIDGPDGDEIVLASEEQKTPLGEFILSYFDYTTGQFPKGETAILTMVEKDYGEHFINPAKQFLEKINNRVSEVMGYRDDEVGESGLQRHIGIKKYGKKGFEELQKAGRDGASEEEKGAIKDKHLSDDIMRLAGL